ncbi:MAG: hypothetical protein K2M71_02460 [Duncaniella sp.]|nr:hypothetical protein [Duncaniella sp.]MDE7474471.1 hypothetical protein [Duncaniella sp.]
MTPITLVDIQSGTFSIPSEISLPSDLRKAEFNIRLRLRFFYQKNRDFVMTEIYTAYLLKEQEIMSFDMTLGFHIKEWAEKLDGLTDISKLKEDKEVLQIAEISVGVLRGTLFEKTQNSPLAPLYLPIADINRVLENCEFIDMASITNE